MPPPKKVTEIHSAFTKKLNEAMAEQAEDVMKKHNILRVDHLGIRTQLRTIEKSPILSDFLLPLIKEPSNRIKEEMKKYASEPTSDELERAFRIYMRGEVAKGLESEPKEGPISKETIEKALKYLKSLPLK